MTHCNLVHNFPMPQAIKKIVCKCCSGQGIEKCRDDSSMGLGTVKVILESYRDNNNLSTLAQWWTNFTSRLESWNQNTKTESCRRPWTVCTEQGTSASQMIVAKSFERVCERIAKFDEERAVEV